MAKDEKSFTHETVAPGVVRPAGQPQPAAAAVAERARREGKKSLTETHLNEQIGKSKDREETIADLMPRPLPAAPGALPVVSPLPLAIQQQAVAVEMARARNLSSANRPTPKDKSYSVVHNGQEFENVKAKDALEAWSQVCDGAKSWPSPKTALVTEVKDESNAGRERSHESGESSVADLDATAAKDSISRMRDREKLQAIVDHDHRVTVQDAARERLAAL